METQLLSTFVTVARLASFSAAAAELGYTQAAISQQVAALEADLKVRLLTRRPVAPTEAGARLLEHAEPLLLRLDAARADVARLTQVPAARLAIGASPLAAVVSRLAPALARLQTRMPRVEITIATRDGGDIAASVARGDVDLGLIDGLTAPNDSLTPFPPLTALGIAESEVVVILPTGHPLTGLPAVRLPNLADARWIDAPAIAPRLADLSRVAGVEGFRPSIRYDGTDAGTLLALAAAGHGLTLLPEAPLPATTGTALCAGLVSMPVLVPPVVHRVELIHGILPTGSPAAELVSLLS